MISADYNAIADVATDLGVPVRWLLELLWFETGMTMDPLARNPNSGARGLIQFVNGTARAMGYTSADDLVAKHPTIASQMPLVESYLRPYRPFPTKQSLFMAVFNPTFRYVPADTEFSARDQHSNPGIVTVADYMRKADFWARNLPAISAGAALVVAAIAAVFIVLQKTGRIA
jgi:hypothetical protein